MQLLSYKRADIARPGLKHPVIGGPKHFMESGSIVRFGEIIIKGCYKLQNITV
jgi:hypothetical protein